jgi:hypothetical protein
MDTSISLPKTVYAIQHLAFEDLGSLEDIFINSVSVFVILKRV